MAEANADQNFDENMSPELALEMESLKTTDRAALLMLLLGEQMASEIVGYLSPKEVQRLGSAMVGVHDVSQEAVDRVLDEFIGELKKQTNLGLGSPDYIEGVLNRALGPERASSVLSRILPSSSSKGLEILSWMTPRAICDMIVDEHPQVIAIILSVLEDETAADVLTFFTAGNPSSGDSPSRFAGHCTTERYGGTRSRDGKTVRDIDHLIRCSRWCESRSQHYGQDQTRY